MIILHKQVCDNDRSFIGTQPNRKEKRENPASAGLDFLFSPFSLSELGSNETLTILDVEMKIINIIGQ